MVVNIATIIATKRVYPLSPNFFNNQYLILKAKVNNIPLSRGFFSNSYFIPTIYNNFKRRRYAYGLSFGIKYSKIKATKQHIPIVNKYPSSSLIPI